MSRYVLEPLVCVRFFFNDTATTEIYTLSLHDALPISWREHIPMRDAEGVNILVSDNFLQRSEEHTSELQSPCNLVCRLLFEKNNRSADLQNHYLLHADAAPRRTYAGIEAERQLFFNDTATTEIYTLSLHAALPI